MASENKISISLDDVNYEINSLDHKKADFIFKIVDGKKVPLTKEELDKIINLLNEQAKKTAPEYQYTEEEVKQLSLDSIFEIIKEKIQYKDYTSLNDIKNYLDSLELNETDKNDIIERSSEYMKELLEKEENQQINDFLRVYREQLHKRREKNIHFEVNVTINSGDIKIEMISKDTNRIDDNIQKMETSFGNTDSVKYYLLNTMAVDFALDANITRNTVTPIVNTLEANMSLANDNNASLNIDGLSRAYAYELQKKVNETKPLVVEEVQEMQEEQETYDNASPEDQLDMDLRQYDGLTDIEKAELKKEKEKGYTRVRTLNNPYTGSSGKMNRAFVLAAIVFGLVLMAISTYIILNK